MPDWWVPFRQLQSEHIANELHKFNCKELIQIEILAQLVRILSIMTRTMRGHSHRRKYYQVTSKIQNNSSHGLHQIRH